MSSSHSMTGEENSQSSVLANARVPPHTGTSYAYHHLPGGQAANMPVSAFCIAV